MDMCVGRGHFVYVCILYSLCTYICVVISIAYVKFTNSKGIHISEHNYFFVELKFNVGQHNTT